MKSKLIAVSFALLLIGAGCARPTLNQQQKSVVTPLVETSISDDETVKTITLNAKPLWLTFPASWRLATDDSGWSDHSKIILSHPAEFIQGTNLGKAIIGFGYMESQTCELESYAKGPMADSLGSAKPSNFVSRDGTQWSVYERGEAAAGTHYQGYLYLMQKGSLCVGASLFLRSANIGALNPDTKEFNKEKIVKDFVDLINNIVVGSHD